MMPRYFDNGSCHSVRLSFADVSEWAQRWPCFGTRRPVWFQFHKQSGDLVDCSETAGMDESGVLALSHDAQAWCNIRATGKTAVFRAGMGVL